MSDVIGWLGHFVGVGVGTAVSTGIFVGVGVDVSCGALIGNGRRTGGMNIRLREGSRFRRTGRYPGNADHKKQNMKNQRMFEHNFFPLTGGTSLTKGHESDLSPFYLRITSTGPVQAFVFKDLLLHFKAQLLQEPRPLLRRQGGFQDIR